MKSEYKFAEEANKRNDIDMEDPEKASKKFPIVICAIPITCALFLRIVIVDVVISTSYSSTIHQNFFFNIEKRHDLHFCIVHV